MTSMVQKREFLHSAKKNKNDEFYTQLIDIEKELEYYTPQFNGKVVYCNCDDPLHSNFYKFFAQNFNQLGLKKLIASCYVAKGDVAFDFDNNNVDKRGYYYVYHGKDSESMLPTLNDIVYFKGDGDFRSDESIELLKEADIVVTNPPFSLFREHINQIIEYHKGFLVIGNVNAITYKNIFDLIQHNQAWLGIHMGRGISGFIVPQHYQLYGTETKIDTNGNRIVSPNNCLWLTNLDNAKRHVDLELTKQYQGNEASYPKYDNYNGINVNKTSDIPKDYHGVMGVPITFLHKYNPEQFEIIKFRKGDDDKDLSVNGKCPYFRILIKNKRPSCTVTVD